MICHVEDSPPANSKPELLVIHKVYAIQFAFPFLPPPLSSSSGSRILYQGGLASIWWLPTPCRLCLRAHFVAATNTTKKNEMHTHIFFMIAVAHF
jgi:hypothetical protein